MAELSPRDRRLLTILGSVLGVIALVAIPIGAEAIVSSRKADVEELRTALNDVQDARSKVRDRQAKKDAVASRYAKQVGSLPTFIEQSARANKLDVSDAVERPVVPYGKRYTERHTVVHFKKAGMGALAKLLESIEKSGHPVVVSRLNIRRRSGEPDSYDVEMGVSAYDRTPDTVKAPPSPAGSASGRAP